MNNKRFIILFIGFIFIVASLLVIFHEEENKKVNKQNITYSELLKKHESNITDGSLYQIDTNYKGSYEKYNEEILLNNLRQINYIKKEYSDSSVREVFHSSNSRYSRIVSENGTENINIYKEDLSFDQRANYGSFYNINRYIPEISGIYENKIKSSALNLKTNNKNHKIYSVEKNLENLTDGMINGNINIKLYYNKEKNIIQRSQIDAHILAGEIEQFKDTRGIGSVKNKRVIINTSIEEKESIFRIPDWVYD